MVFLGRVVENNQETVRQRHEGCSRAQSQLRRVSQFEISHRRSPLAAKLDEHVGVRFPDLTGPATSAEAILTEGWAQA